MLKEIIFILAVCVSGQSFADQQICTDEIAPVKLLVRIAKINDSNYVIPKQALDNKINKIKNIISSTSEKLNPIRIADCKKMLDEHVAYRRENYESEKKAVISPPINNGGVNRIRSREGNIVNGTCASGNDFNAILDTSDGRWMTAGGRNGMQFASNLDEAVRKVCN